MFKYLLPSGNIYDYKNSQAASGSVINWHPDSVALVYESADPAPKETYADSQYWQIFLQLIFFMPNIFLIPP